MALPCAPADFQGNSPEGENAGEGRTTKVRENGWLGLIEDEDSVPVIRHRLPPRFGNQAPSIRVDHVQVHPPWLVRNRVTDLLLQKCARATRQLSTNSPCLSPDGKRLCLLKEKDRLLDELAKLQLHTASVSQRAV